MIIDCHTHINFETEEVSIAEHLESGETVDACIVLADYEAKNINANEKLAEYISKIGNNKAIGFACIDPVKDSVSTNGITALTEKNGLSGIVLYCSACGFHPAHSRAMRLYESADELGLPIFLHNSGHLKSNAILDYAQPYLIDEIARLFPKLKIIIGSMGMPFYQQTLTMIAKHENVYADLTIRKTSPWQLYNIVIHAYEQNLMDKLLFGSGFPAGNAKQSIETLLGFNKLLGDTNLPTVPRGSIRNIIERDTLGILGLSFDISE